jgi:hypothetical protein
MRSFMICRLSLTQYLFSDQIKKNEMDVACGMYGERSADTVLVRKHEGRRPLGRPRRGLEDNIKMVLQEI